MADPLDSPVSSKRLLGSAVDQKLRSCLIPEREKEDGVNPSKPDFQRSPMFVLDPFARLWVVEVLFNPGIYVPLSMHPNIFTVMVVDPYPLDMIVNSPPCQV
ncbi:hypothetical protein QQF64_026002 [Cirrhinus molitorella]|uniref:Uncharacterized protein n=1 Tax=Cirrhinus molitorella TaxID=172907 RepID=A0ABR3NQN1_9TELE